MKAPQVKKLVVLDVPGLLSRHESERAAFITRHGGALTHLTVCPTAVRGSELCRLPKLESLKLCGKASDQHLNLCNGQSTHWASVARFATACPTLCKLDVERIILPTATDSMGLGGVEVLRAGLESQRKSVRPELQSIPVDAFISALRPPIRNVRFRWVGKDPPELVAPIEPLPGLDWQLDGVEMEVQAEEEEEEVQVEEEEEEEEEVQVEVDWDNSGDL